MVTAKSLDLRRRIARRRERPRWVAPASRRSRIALNGVNFFLAELSGIGSPYLSDFLHNAGWKERSIGAAASIPGLGVFLLLPFVGALLDRADHPRRFLLVAALAVGVCYAALPSLEYASPFPVYAVLFVSGLAQAFFAPLLSGLALGLAGHAHINRVMGSNQAWNHIGDVIAATVALWLTRGSVSRVFYLVSGIAVLAATSGLIIRPNEIDRERACGGTERRVPLHVLLKDRRVLVLLVSTALFHMTYESVFPFVVIRVRHFGGADWMVALLVMISQGAMVPVALLAGRALHRGRHKPVFAAGFLVLPVFVLACAVLHGTTSLAAAQVLGSVSAGIFGVAVVTFCADLARGTGHFQALTGASNAAMAGGAVVGPVATGFMEQDLGHEFAFFVLAAVATTAAIVFLAGMPETRPR